MREGLRGGLAIADNPSYFESRRGTEPQRARPLRCEAAPPKTKGPRAGRDGFLKRLGTASLYVPAQFGSLPRRDAEAPSSPSLLLEAGRHPSSGRSPSSSPYDPLPWRLRLEGCGSATRLGRSRDRRGRALVAQASERMPLRPALLDPGAASSDHARPFARGALAVGRRADPGDRAGHRLLLAAGRRVG